MDLFGPDSPKPNKKKTNPNWKNYQKKQPAPKRQLTEENTKNDENNQQEKIEEPSLQANKKSSGQTRNNNPKRRRQKRPKKQEVIQENKPKKQQITIPLMIKTYPNLLSTDEFQQPLEQFVDSIYSQNKKHEQKTVINSFQQEDDYGNIEYKLKLIHPSEQRLQHLATQMKFRVREGVGQAYYRIGVEDCGRPMGLQRDDMFESLKTICRLARKVQLDVIVVRVSQGIKGLIAQLMVRKNFRQGVKLEIRLLLFGQVGSGKSTLLGVLKTGQKDDGKGLCRSMVVTHRHELMSGTTMTKSHHMIGFDSQGNLYNHRLMMTSQTWLDNANKLLSFIDVGGHKKAQKQIVSSLCSFYPQYGLWVLSAKGKLNTESQSNNLYNLQLAKIFNLPLIVVITHIDLVNKDQQMETIYQTKRALRNLYPDKTPCIVKEMEHAVLFSRIASTQDVIPIFLISNVTGKNLDLLTNFFNLLPSTSQLKNNEDLNSQFLIADKYIVDGRIILAGTVIKGTIKISQILHLGPDQKGSFRAIQIISIECMRVPVKLAKCGQIATIAIRPLTYAKEWLQKEPNAIRRGMVLIQSKSNPKATYEFLAELSTYGKEEVTITSNYQPVLNTQTTRQICSIVTMGANNQKIQPIIPQMILSKKSKSIDSSKKRNHFPRGLSSNSLVSSSHKLSNKTYNSKKSLDLTNSNDMMDESSPNQSNQKKPKQKISPDLSTIVEKQATKAKKKKEKQQIKFGNKKGTLVRLRFKYSPQYVTVGQKIVVNELKLIGRVKQIFY